LRCALDLEEHLVVVVRHFDIEVLGLRLFGLVRVGRSFGRHVCGAGVISERDTVGKRVSRVACACVVMLTYIPM